MQKVKIQVPTFLFCRVKLVSPLFYFYQTKPAAIFYPSPLLLKMIDDDKAGSVAVGQEAEGRRPQAEAGQRAGRLTVHPGGQARQRSLVTGWLFHRARPRLRGERHRVKGWHRVKVENLAPLRDSSQEWVLYFSPGGEETTRLEHQCWVSF
jgi:hypothetical protein